MTGQPPQHRGEVEAGPGAHIHDEARLARRRHGRLGQGISDEVEVTRAEELGSRRHHVCGVAAGGRPTGQQVDVALPRHVEAVSVGADQRRSGLAELRGTDRTAQRRHHLRQHGRSA